MEILEGELAEIEQILENTRDLYHAIQRKARRLYQHINDKENNPVMITREGADFLEQMEQKVLEYENDLAEIRGDMEDLQAQRLSLIERMLNFANFPHPREGPN